ncbi:RloB family protein [Plantactinospora siamensis]|uniref:RloB family protein n=1 Tax=Plantactinospora siamensis TaxID=555372 RepID=A0ABV6NYP3_9ACTN
MREQRRTVLIATNGESTERAYFSGLKQEFTTHRVMVVVERGSPLEVVRGAARRRDANDVDEAWAVCDVDQYRTQETDAAATANQVRLAWSNPCFEIWLLLHYVDCFGYVKNADEATEKLTRHIRNWDKTALDFDLFRTRVGAAVRRAKRLGEPPEANPSTAVWQVVEALS